MDSPGEKVLAFFRYLELDNAGALRNHMERSKKDVDAVLAARPMKPAGSLGRLGTPGAPSRKKGDSTRTTPEPGSEPSGDNEPRQVTFRGKDGDMDPGGDGGGGNTHRSEASAMSTGRRGVGAALAGRRDAAGMEGLLGGDGQAPAAKDESKEDQRLRLIFYAYCSQSDRFGQQMGPSGFHKLCKETQLLDNTFGYSDADIILSLADAAGGAKGAAEVTGQVKGDRKVAWDEFKMLLHTLADRRFPKLPDHDSRYHRLLAAHIFPFASRVAKPTPVDELYEGDVVELFERFSRTLWSVFMHYATLDLVSVDHSNWAAVRHANRTINLDEYLMFMLNFEVTPQLLSKREVTAIFRAANVGESSDANVDDLCYPEFLECLGRCALVVSLRMDEKMSSHTLTVHERSAVMRMVTYAGPGAQAHFQRLVDKRKLGLSGSKTKHFSNLDDAILKAARDREEEVARDHKVAGLMGVSYESMRKPEAARKSSIFVKMSTLSEFIQEDFEDGERFTAGLAESTEKSVKEITTFQDQQVRNEYLKENKRMGLANRAMKVTGLGVNDVPSTLITERPCSRGTYVL